MKPNAPSCERNQEPILKALKSFITRDFNNLLEVGSGTGQHAVFLAPHFPNLTWTTSDVLENHPGISMWQNESDAPNVQGPIHFEVGVTKFPESQFEAVYTANTFHIMSWKKVKTLIKLLGDNLQVGGLVFIYGPFNYHDKFTSPSNEEFDKTLKARDPSSGIRSFENVTKAFSKNGFFLKSDLEMPANNRFLVFQKD